jgi:cytidine deaminase
MSGLLDKMFLKKFCLPVNSDIEQYKNGNIHINTCFCGHYNHVSCILQEGNGNLKKARVLSYGVNQMGDTKGLMPGIHAEHDAIRKLRPLKKQNKKKLINILVIRLSAKNKLQTSKPCINCIETMKNLPDKLGYKIQKVFYSDGSGNIVKISLKKLENEEKHMSKFYKRKHNRLI